MQRLPLCKHNFMQSPKQRYMARAVTISILLRILRTDRKNTRFQGFYGHSICSKWYLDWPGDLLGCRTQKLNPPLHKGFLLPYYTQKKTKLQRKERQLSKAISIRSVTPRETFPLDCIIL